jgi:CHAD domain-containing protein
MLHKKRLSKYLDKQLNGLQNNLEEMSAPVDKNKLHDLRLHAKKVKAMSGFLKETLPDKNKYSTKDLKELFHTAGDIRTAQLNLETLEEHKIDNETFKRDQENIIEKDSARIVSDNKKFGRDISSLRKRIGKNLTTIKNNKIVAFYYENIKTLSNNFKVIDEAKLHESRKIIKKLLYDLKILPPALVNEIGVNKEYLDKIQDLIGNWHDTDVTLDLLKKAGTTGSPGLTSVSTQKQDQLEKIIQETRDFDTSVLLAKH